MNRVFINNQIRAIKVRVIDNEGKQLGVLDLQEALSMAKEKGFDLIQVTEKVDPPVCKIMDYGKYLYQQQKKEKEAKPQKGGQMKSIRLTFNISDHDIQVRADHAVKMLKQGNKIRVEMRIKGRENTHQDFARDKFKKFAEMLQKTTDIKIEKDLKRDRGNLMMIISK